MIHQRAEDCFREGKELLESGNAAGALSQFKAAIDIERSRGVTDEGQARYLSYYGLCLALSRRRFAEAVHYCQQATRRESYHAVTWWNLGRVNFAFGRRRAAWRAWQKGLEVQPGHPGIERDIERMGRRREPVLSVVSRSHPLNIVLGKLRARLAPGASVVTTAGQPPVGRRAAAPRA